MNVPNKVAERISKTLGLFQRVLADAKKRDVNESDTVVFMADVPFRLEHAQLGAHGGVARLAGKLLTDLAGGGATEPVQDVDDLALASRQLVVQGLGHMLFS